MSEEKPMSDKCIACDGPLNFTVQLILSSRGSSPRRQQSSKVIAVCDPCCHPGQTGAGWTRLQRALVTELWMNRNIHRRKLEDSAQAPVDAKSAAAGGDL